MWVGTENLLSVQLQDQSQHTVRSRVLGTEVDWIAYEQVCCRLRQHVPVKCRMLASFLVVPSFKISSALIP